MTRRLARSMLTLLIALLVVACGRRETAAPLAQGSAPSPADPIVAATPTLPPFPTLDPQASTPEPLPHDGLQQTEQSLSLTFTAEPANPAAYTAYAIFDAQRASASAAGASPPTGTPTIPGNANGPPPTHAPTHPGDQLTSEEATAARALDYTATAAVLADEQLTSAAATATMGTLLGLPTSTPTPTAAPKGALRYHLPPDVGERFVIYSYPPTHETYFAALTPRGEAPSRENYVTLNGGLQVEVAWDLVLAYQDVRTERATVRGVDGWVQIGQGKDTIVLWQEDGQRYMVIFASASRDEAVAFVDTLVSHERAEWEAITRRFQQ